MAEIANVIKTFTAGEALAAYRFVRLSAASGTSVVYTDATEEILGVTEAAAASGAPVAVRLWPGSSTFKVTASEAITVGSALYTAADGKVSDTALGYSIGRALSAASADGGVIEVAPIGITGGLKYRAVAASADVENTTTETAFDKSYTFPAGALKAGDVIKVRASCFVLDNNSTDTLNLKMYLGTEEIAATGAVDVADGDVGYFDVMIVIRTAGSSATLVATGVTALGVPGTVTAKPFTKASATEDLSGAVALTIKATWSVAHADNEVYLDVLTVEHLPA